MYLCWMRLAVACFSLFAIPSYAANADVQTNQLQLTLSCAQGCLWAYRTTHTDPNTDSRRQSFPSIPGRSRPRFFISSPLEPPIHLDNGATEYSFAGNLAQDPHLQLLVQFQVNNETPVIRFRYTLKSDQARALTARGANRLSYLETSLNQLPAAEESDTVETLRS